MNDTPTEDVGHGEYWRLEDLDVESEVYCFVGIGGPPSSDAVAKAKKQFAKTTSSSTAMSSGRRSRQHLVALAARSGSSCISLEGNRTRCYRDVAKGY